MIAHAAGRRARSALVDAHLRRPPAGRRRVVAQQLGHGDEAGVLRAQSLDELLDRSDRSPPPSCMSTIAPGRAAATTRSTIRCTPGRS